MNGVDKTFCCIPCEYFCKTNSNLTKHKCTKKHADKIQNPDVVEECKYKCKNCVKTYKSHQGLWVHKKKCKTPETILPVSTPEVDLHAKIDNLERIILGMANNQQPTTINNCINNDNSIKNYINIFLNDKCRNACDIKDFIAGIDFSKENYQNILLDYVGGNAEIITMSYKRLPEFERPVYSFSGEDEHQKVAHIQHDDKWITEHEVTWMNQVRKEYNDGLNDDPEPNSMYSLVRLFDKKKMEYFDENYKQSHLYLSQRKLNKDCLDDGKQLEIERTAIKSKAEQFAVDNPYLKVSITTLKSESWKQAHSTATVEEILKFYKEDEEAYEAVSVCAAFLGLTSASDVEKMVQFNLST